MPMLKKNYKKKKDLNLGYPTWLSLPDWAVKTVVPFTRDYQKVILHALVRFREEQDEFDNKGSRLKVIP